MGKLYEVQTYVKKVNSIGTCKKPFVWNRCIKIFYEKGKKEKMVVQPRTVKKCSAAQKQFMYQEPKSWAFLVQNTEKELQVYMIEI